MRQVRGLGGLAVIVAALLAAPHVALADGVTWTDTSGSWNDPANWSSNPALPGAGDDVTISVGGGNTITHPSGNHTVKSLTNAEAILVTGGALTVLGGAPSSNAGGALLVTGGALTLGGTWTNGGTIANQASALTFFGGFNTNVANVTTFGAATTTLNVASFGLLSSFTNGSGGTVIVGGPANQISNLTNEAGATVQILDGTTLTLSGPTITNNGIINLSSGPGAGSMLRFDAFSTLVGNGTLNVMNLGVGPVIQIDAGLVNGPGHTIQGGGQFAFGGGAFANVGAISANAFGGFSFNNGGLVSHFTNVGVVQATGTGQALTIAGPGDMVHNAAGGLIEAINGGTVTITPSNGTIDNSGTVRANGPGSTMFLAPQSFINQNGGLVEAFGGGSVTISPAGGTGTIQNQQGIVRAVGPSSALTLNGLVTNGGGGNATFEAAHGGLLVVSGTLQNFVGTTLTGSGAAFNVIGPSTMRLPGSIEVNNATILLDGPGSQLLGSGGANALANLNANGGALTILNGRNLGTLLGFANSGTVTIGTLSAFTTGLGPLQDYTQTNGSTTVNGALGARNVVLAGGTLGGGGGGVTANVLNTGGTVAPGSSPGSLAIFGNYTQTAGGVLAIQLGGLAPGLGYDVLNVQDAATLGGLLHVDLFGGFDPTADASFDVLLANRLVGSFDAVELPTSTHGLFSVEYLRDPNRPNAVRIVFDAPDGDAAPVPEPGTFALLGVGCAIAALWAARRARALAP